MALSTALTKLERVRVEPPGKILLVDDDDGLRELMADMLEAEGYEVTARAGPLDALGLAGGQFDLLIADLVMPGMGGHDLARELLRRAPGLRVLYVSGYGGEVLKHRAESGPGERFLLKPFTRKEFLEAVAGALRD